VDITDAMNMAKRKNHHNSAKICPAVSTISHTSKNMLQSPLQRHIRRTSDSQLPF
jgi:hypothetical protein